MRHWAEVVIDKNPRRAKSRDRRAQGARVLLTRCRCEKGRASPLRPLSTLRSPGCATTPAKPHRGTRTAQRGCWRASFSGSLFEESCVRWGEQQRSSVYVGLRALISAMYSWYRPSLYPVLVPKLNIYNPVPCRTSTYCPASTNVVLSATWLKGWFSQPANGLRGASSSR